MPCNHPLPAWRSNEPNERGKRPPVFTFGPGAGNGSHSEPLNIPCGRCMGCRLDRARTWATRLVHEAKLYDHNWFATLTYDDDHLKRTPAGRPTLCPEDFVLFMKRLRKKMGPNIRFYQCGEYGETTERPHHHAILFNLPLSDLQPVTRARNAHTLYTSKALLDTWQQGHISVGAVTFETAAYVASYVNKKITGPMAESHYQGRTPEYSTMSRRPGIARTFIENFLTDVYPSDEVIMRGHPARPPRYYDDQLLRIDDQLHAQVVTQRTLAKRRPTTDKEKHQHRLATELTTTQNIRKRDAQ